MGGQIYSIAIENGCSSRSTLSLSSFVISVNYCGKLYSASKALGSWLFIGGGATKELLGQCE